MSKIETRPHSPKVTPILLVLIILMLIGVSITYLPNPFWAPKLARNVVLLDGKMLPDPVKVTSQQQVLLPFTTIQEYVDPYLRWEEKNQSVIVTTESRLLKMETDELTIPHPRMHERALRVLGSSPRPLSPYGQALSKHQGDRSRLTP